MNADKEFLVYIVNGIRFGRSYSEMKVVSPELDKEGGHVGRMYAVTINDMTGKPEFRPIGVQ